MYSNALEIELVNGSLHDWFISVFWSEFSRCVGNKILNMQRDDFLSVFFWSKDQIVKLFHNLHQPFREPKYRPSDYFTTEMILSIDRVRPIFQAPII